MRYSIKFYKGCRKLNRVSEVILKYNEIHETLSEYIVENYAQGQRIVIDISNYNIDLEDFLKDNLKILKETREKHKNIAIKLNCVTQLKFAETLKEEEFNYFYDLMVDTWDKLAAAVTLGVSDVYICNEFAFSLKEIAKYCHSRNIRIRVYPNVAQTSFKEIEGRNPLTKFFIRPEDIPFYEPYIDVLEFFVDQLDKQDVLYDIYKNQRWQGNLSILILGLSENELFNYNILPDFGENRVSCDKRCCLNKCHICDRMMDFIAVAKDIKEESGQDLVVRSIYGKDREVEFELDENFDEND